VRQRRSADSLHETAPAPSHPHGWEASTRSNVRWGSLARSERLSAREPILGTSGSPRSALRFGVRSSRIALWKSPSPPRPISHDSRLWFLPILASRSSRCLATSAAASAVEVRLREDSGQMHVEVIDDGRGFDASTVRRGAGLTDMEDHRRARRQSAGCIDPRQRNNAPRHGASRPRLAAGDLSPSGRGSRNKLARWGARRSSPNGADVRPMELPLRCHLRHANDAEGSSRSTHRRT
jgi:hypothetical protein